MEDPLAVVSDLRPAGLDRLADDTYARRRAGDLARMLGEPAAAGLPLAPAESPAACGLPAASRLPAPAGGWRSAVRPGRVLRPRVLLGAGAGLAAAAVAAALLIAVPAHGQHAQSGGKPGGVTGGEPGTAHAVLLTAAHVAAAQPPVIGKYWYVRERDFEPTAAVGAGKTGSKGGTGVKESGFGASFAATAETWTSASRTRTIVNEKLVFGFASAAGKQRWEAAGSPRLAGPAGIGRTGPVTSNYPFGGYSYNIGAIKVGLFAAGRLPVNPGKLGALIRRGWDGLSPAQRAATVGVPKPSFAQYLFQVAGALLTGPVTPGTRSAVYDLLAKESLTVAANVTDPLGRTGTAVGDGTGDFLIIDPATAQVLDLTTYPVRTGATISGKLGGTEAYLSMGWTSRLGIPAGS